MEFTNNLLEESKNIFNKNTFMESSKDYLNSNTFVAKISFVILVIIVFILLFNFSFSIMNTLITPNRSPYLINGMIDARNMKVIKQDLRESGAIPIFRSRDQYNGIEMTWSTWIYINDATFGQEIERHNTIFVKGSNSQNIENMNIMSSLQNNIFQNSNGPGLYLRASAPVNYSSFNNNIKNSLLMNLHVIVDIFPFKDPISNNNIFKQEIVIPAIPIKKWVSIILRFSTQNIVDVFINGSLQKRVKLFNTVRQNYEDVFISPSGGFDGFISNLRYFDYSIGTFEINQIVNSGPNLRMDENTNMKTAFPLYLSTKWLFGETNVS